MKIDIDIYPNLSSFEHLTLFHVDGDRNSSPTSNLSVKLLEKSEKDEIDQKTDRQKWSNKADFFLSVLGFAVGMGAVWRFPYLCMKNGGGAFLVPYLIFLLFLGIPLFGMELAIGQFTSRSPSNCWGYCPLVKGCGYTMMIISVVVSIYNNIIIAWSFFYTANSFRHTVPWSHCKNDYNNEHCMTRMNNDNGTDNLTTNILLSNHSTTTMSTELFEKTLTNQSIDYVTSSQQFFHRRLLRLSNGVDDVGFPQYEIVLCLAAAWILTFLCLFKGVKSSGKAAWVAALSPYVLITILLIRGCTLEGAADGIKYFIVPKWKDVMRMSVWADACIQIFFMLGPAWGGVITMASYNEYNHRFIYDAFFIPVLTAFTGVYCGFAMFAALGYMARKANTTIEKVAANGPGLCFIVYPEAISNLPLPQLWSILFFLMLISLSIGTQFGLFQTVSSCIFDLYPSLNRMRGRVIGFLCFLFFGVGVLFTTNAGMYFYQIVDWYAPMFSLMLTGLVQCIAIGWIYGAERFRTDIRIMLKGYCLSRIWVVMWKYVTPTLLLVIIGFIISSNTSPEYAKYEYPKIAIIIGWMIAIIPILPIFFYAIYYFWKADGSSFQEKWKNAILPKDWRPDQDLDKHEWAQNVKHHVEKRGKNYKLTEHTNIHEIELEDSFVAHKDLEREASKNSIFNFSNLKKKHFAQDDGQNEHLRS
ncbi:hypothetical protein SNEBB_003183 [Seison nebaliae]|nr:hypothetical protein SNEBB_003183 [Seison nebaliae]